MRNVSQRVFVRSWASVTRCCGVTSWEGRENQKEKIEKKTGQRFSSWYVEEVASTCRLYFFSLFISRYTFTRIPNPLQNNLKWKLPLFFLNLVQFQSSVKRKRIPKFFNLIFDQSLDYFNPHTVITRHISPFFSSRTPRNKRGKKVGK